MLKILCEFLGDDNIFENTRKKGNDGEKIAVTELIKKGYTILETNYYGSHGEIDIIAKHDGYIIFVEVKLRKSLSNGYPSEAVDKRKQTRIIRTAEEYIYKNKIGEVDFRFDVMEIICSGDRVLLNHIVDAFWN